MAGASRRGAPRPLSADRIHGDRREPPAAPDHADTRGRRLDAAVRRPARSSDPANNGSRNLSGAVTAKLPVLRRLDLVIFAAEGDQPLQEYGKQPIALLGGG